MRPHIQLCEWEVLSVVDGANTQAGRQCQESEQGIVWLVGGASQHVSRRTCAVAVMRRHAQGTHAAAVGATASKDRAWVARLVGACIGGNAQLLMFVVCPAYCRIRSQDVSSQWRAAVAYLLAIANSLSITSSPNVWVRALHVAQTLSYTPTPSGGAVAGRVEGGQCWENKHGGGGLAGTEGEMSKSRTPETF